MNLFLKSTGDINLTELSKSKFCDVSLSALSKERSRTPEKFQTRYLGIVCQENSIDIKTLKVVKNILELCKKNN